MSQRGLEALLRPKSIAVIGASMKPQRAGYLHDAQPVSRRLQWPGDAGHPRLEGGSWGTGMAYHREPAVYPGSGGALY